MQQIHLNDDVFKAAQQRAAAGGYSSVDAYISEIVEHDINDEDNFDHLFTHEIMAHLDQIASAAAARGKTYTSAEISEHFQKKSLARQEHHPT